jgi:Ulp1 family protease
MQSVDIFSKDFLFIPIHEGLHWSLVVVTHPGNWHLDKKATNSTHGHAMILHFDSLRELMLCVRVGVCVSGCVQGKGGRSGSLKR